MFKGEYIKARIYGRRTILEQINEEVIKNSIDFYKKDMDKDKLHLTYIISNTENCCNFEFVNASPLKYVYLELLSSKKSEKLPNELDLLDLTTKYDVTIEYFTDDLCNAQTVNCLLYKGEVIKDERKTYLVLHFIEGEDYCESNLDITDDEVMNTLFDKFLKRNCIFKDETCNPDTEKFVEYIHSVFHIDRSDLYATFCKALKESLEVNNGDLLLKLEMFDNNRSRFGRDKFHNDWHSSIFFPYSYTTSCF